MVESFNKELNRSYDARRSYDLYKDYRRRVSQAIKEVIKGKEMVLLVGAGHLNDVDLDTFNGSRLDCLDIDLESVKTGIERQGHGMETYGLIKADLTGLEGTSFFPNYDLEDIETYKTVDLSIDLGLYDVIVILPVYTQLLLPQLMTDLPYNQLKDYLPLIQSRINILNTFLRRHLNDGGHLIAFSDVLEYSRGSEEAQFLLAHEDHPMLLDDFFLNYLSRYGHGLGSYGLLEMSENLKTIKESYLIWPFTEDRLMLVKMIKSKK